MDYWTDEIGLVALCTLKNCFDFENVKRDALVLHDFHSTTLCCQ